MTPGLFVHSEVIARINCTPARPFEVGGWLLGFWAEDASAVFVTHATPPASHGSPFGVRISGRGHRQRFDDAWDATDGVVTFLGDWHTHPGCPPLPSQQDAKAMEQLAGREQYGTPYPLMAILSTPRWPWKHNTGNASFQLAFYLRDARSRIVALAPKLVDTLPPDAKQVPEWAWPKIRSTRPFLHVVGLPDAATADASTT
jgi:integrative and conjugative element protein (TIGR02256 family)